MEFQLLLTIASSCSLTSQRINKCESFSLQLYLRTSAYLHVWLYRLRSRHVPDHKLQSLPPLEPHPTQIPPQGKFDLPCLLKQHLSSFLLRIIPYKVMILRDYCLILSQTPAPALACGSSIPASQSSRYYTGTLPVAPFPPFFLTSYSASSARLSVVSSVSSGSISLYPTLTLKDISIPFDSKVIGILTISSI